MKACFCIDDAGLDRELGQWLTVAVRSVVANTSLQPVIISPSISPERLRVYETEGAIIQHARSRLAPVITAKSGYRTLPPWTEGALLRYELPSLFPEDDWIVYADCDTYFVQDPEIDFHSIDFIGAVKSSLEPDCVTFNSGVLVFKQSGFATIEEILFSFLESTLGDWLPSSVDQSALNAILGNRISSLDPKLNWRPNFGFNPDANIIHFHSIRFQYAEWLLTGDYRGFERELLLSGYINEYVRHVSGSLHNAMRYLAGIRRHLVGTSLEMQIDRLSEQMETSSLLQNAMAAHAEVGAAGFQALQLAKTVTYTTSATSIRFCYAGHYQGASAFQIHTCRFFGFGRLTIRFASVRLTDRVQLFHSPSMFVEQVRPDPCTISCYWSGIGIDCHLLLTSTDDSFGISSFTIECVGYGTLDLIVSALQGGEFVPIVSDR